MELYRLSQEELYHLYHTSMKRDFPPSELRPYISIRSLSEQGHYRCVGCRVQDDPAAYACLAGDGEDLLLDYYAVEPQLRGQGIGGRFLRALKEKEASVKGAAPFLLIEAESVESAASPERVRERERRLRFYRKCGCLKTGVYSFLYGVEYQILCLPLKETSPDALAVKAALERIYDLIVRPLAPKEEDFRKVCRVFTRSPSGC